MPFIKVDDNTIKKVVEVTETKESSYDYDFLLSQKKAIQAQKDRDNAQRDKELSEVDELISQADSLGIASKVEKPKEVVEDEVPFAEPPKEG